MARGNGCDKNTLVAYYLGLDGGGSKTTCVVGDDTTVLATAVSGPSNITRVGNDKARESLHQAIRDACAAAEVNPSRLQHSCIGAAGAGHQEIAEVVREIVAEVIPGKIMVVGDMQIALQAAFGDGPGVMVIAGTGSIAYGRNAEGKITRAGGWGFAISDEGSAHWIGRMAISSILRETDELGAVRTTRPVSRLFQEIGWTWHVESTAELARTANQSANFAELLPAVAAAADAGDELAEKVLTQAGRELAELARIVLLRLFPDDDSHKCVAMVGGVFRHAHRTREVFCANVRAARRHVNVNSEVVEPVGGALQIARNSAR
jgi:glucosamine kinase